MEYTSESILGKREQQITDDLTENRLMVEDVHGGAPLDLDVLEYADWLDRHTNWDVYCYTEAVRVTLEVIRRINKKRMDGIEALECEKLLEELCGIL